MFTIIVCIALAFGLLEIVSNMFTPSCPTGTEKPTMGHHYQRDAVFHGMLGL